MGCRKYLYLFWMGIGSLLLTSSGCQPDSKQPSPTAARTNVTPPAVGPEAERIVASPAPPQPVGQATPVQVPSLRYRVIESRTYTGCCDGSGSALFARRWLLTVNDEDSTIRVYDPSGGRPLAELNARKFLDLKKKDEADLEGAAIIGSRLYVIGSHSRDSDGKKRKDTRQFFGVDLQPSDNTIQLRPVGQSYSDLLDDLEDASHLSDLQLDKASKEDGDSRSGLSIEGLCSTPDDTLLIGFRGPVIDRQALILSLANPNDVIQGEEAQIDASTLLDLGGRGIRGLARYGTDYYLVGEFPGGGSIAMFRWNGEPSSPPERLPIPAFSADPESLIVSPLPHQPAGLSILLLTDDGSRRLVGNLDCKDVENPNHRRFRGLLVVGE